MAILEGGHIVPPRTQATSRSPAPLGLIIMIRGYLQKKYVPIDYDKTKL